MSPMKFILVLAVAICATQSAQSLSFQSIADDAIGKVKGLIESMENKIKSNMDEAKNYLDKVENTVLDQVNEELKKRGINVDIRSIYDSIKSNVTVCADKSHYIRRIEEVRNDLLSCAGSEVRELKLVANNVREAWEIAVGLPSVLKTIFSRCLKKGDDPAKNEFPEVTIENREDVDGVPTAIENPNNRNKRSVLRVFKCSMAAYDAANMHLKGMHSKISTLAQDLARIVRHSNVRDFAPCVVNKVSENANKMVDLSKDILSCVSAEVIPGGASLSG